MKKFLAVGALLFVFIPALASAKTNVALERNLSSKMSGTDVTVLQKYLINIGILKTKANGYFGPATVAAIKTFQKQNNISVTGALGPITRALINSRLSGASAGQTDATANQQVSSADINTVKSYLNDIKQGFLTGNLNLILEHSSVSTTQLMSSATFGSQVNSFTVNAVYQSGANIVANVTATGSLSGRPPTQNLVFIRENGDWKFDMAATLRYGTTTAQFRK